MALSIVAVEIVHYYLQGFENAELRVVGYEDETKNFPWSLVCWTYTLGLGNQKYDGLAFYNKHK